IQQLVRFIRSLRVSGEEPGGTPAAPPSFSEQILPLLEAKCSLCHNQKTKLGGWDASSYEAVMTTGDHAPVVIPGDAAASLLSQKVSGAQAQGDIMPPAGLLPEDEIQLIVDWIAAGAPEK
ncbi:MAG: c-type cytochrome domain-containing protein, partial [Chloroflexota bacterium]